MIYSYILTRTEAAIFLAILWEPTFGFHWVTSDAIIQNVWPDSTVQNSVKLKRASPLVNNIAGGGKQSSANTPQLVDQSQDDDDVLVFEGRYFSPNEVPPPPEFMRLNTNWRGESTIKVVSPDPTPPSSSHRLQMQQRSSKFTMEGGTLSSVVTPLGFHKFTVENAKGSKNMSDVETDATSSSSSKNIVPSPVPLKDLPYHEEDMIAFEQIYKNAPKCFTPTDIPGRCIPFRNCFPVVFNFINGELRNPGLAKLLYQASGPCNASLELDFALKNLNSEKMFYNAKFYNLSICCPGFKHPPSLLKEWTMDVRNARLITTNFSRHFEHGHPTGPSVSFTTALSRNDSFTKNDSGVTDKYNTSFVASRLDDHNAQDSGAKKPTFHSLEVGESWLENINAGDEVEDAADADEAQTEEFEVINDADDSDNFTEREHVRLTAAVNRENSKVSPIKNYTRLEDTVEVRRGDRYKVKKGHGNGNLKRPTDAFLAVQPPSVAPSCKHQLYGMPRGHWPWMVALVISSRHICSGALIDDMHIVTAAHCVYLLPENEVRKLRVIIGDRVMYSSVDGPHFWRKVSKITTHLNYNQQTFVRKKASDIAILKMNSAVPFSRNVQPVSLLDGSFEIDDLQKGIVAGWSGADIGQPAFEPRTEVETVVDIMDKEACRDVYRGFALSGIATNTFCTKPANNSCVADSGAPLITRIQNCWRLMGIMSWGIGCNHFPEVYTDVSRYMTWIMKHLD